MKNAHLNRPPLMRPSLRSIGTLWGGVRRSAAPDQPESSSFAMKVRRAVNPAGRSHMQRRVIPRAAAHDHQIALRVGTVFAPIAEIIRVRAIPAHRTRGCRCSRRDHTDKGDTLSASTRQRARPSSCGSAVLQMPEHALSLCHCQVSIRREACPQARKGAERLAPVEPAQSIRCGRSQMRAAGQVL